MPDSHNTVDQSNDTVSMSNFKPVPNPTQSKRKSVRKPVIQKAESTCSTHKTTTRKRQGKVANQLLKMSASS